MKPLKNIFISDCPISPSDFLDPSYYTSAPLEEYGNLSLLVLALMLINYCLILGLFIIIVNQVVSTFKLESRKFIMDRPFLLKVISYSAKSRKIMSNIMLGFCLFGACSMYYYLGYLLHFLKDLNV